MSLIAREVDIDQLRALDLHEGDTLRVVSEEGPKAVVHIERAAEEQPACSGESPIRAWLQSARGAVQGSSEADIDAARMAYYSEKFGLQP